MKDDKVLCLGHTEEEFNKEIEVKQSKTSMEMEGRGYSDFYRNTSEELFIKTMMESTIGMPVPTMEMLGFKNLSQSLRTDSEELFNSWLKNGENNGGNSISITHRSRQASRRISAEISNLSNQQYDGLQKKGNENILFPENSSTAGESLNVLNQHTMGNVVDRGLQASNLFLAKAWFQSSQPMTRSRSSELRRKYAAMQNCQTSVGIEAMHNLTGNGINNFKQEYRDPNEFHIVGMSEIPNQQNTFMSPSNSSSSTFNAPQVGNADNISSVVSMLKGTLERKKLQNPVDREAIEDSCFGYYGSEDVLGNTGLNQVQSNHIYEMQGSFQNISTVQVTEAGVLQAAEGSYGIGLESIITPTNPLQMSTVSREPSQSESSAAAPVVSTGFDVCDGPSISSQVPSVCESSRKQLGRNIENSSRCKDVREHIYENLKDDKKKGGLLRYGSVTSTGSVEQADPTKKRRVERSRKMAEAKERNSIPAVPSDMQSILKRCENLEKEVRSLKLNLAFMNRKDSEQTKQIEELEKQNEDLAKEKERLLEEIERIISETAKM